MPAVYPSHIDLSKLNHHILLYKCPRATHQDASINKNLGKVYPCFSINNETKLINAKCNRLILTSPIRATDAVIFPDDAGVVFDPEESPFFIQESHLINTMDEPLNLKVILKLSATSEILRMVEVNLKFILL